MHSDSTVRLGIIGTGQRAVSFVNQLKKIPEATLTALCDTNAHRLSAFAREKDCADVFQTEQLDETLAGDRVDAVVITVPDFAHKDVAVQCFDAGKHVLLEKPMALTAEDCRAIIRAKERSGCTMQMGFVLRCTNFFGTIKEIVSSGRLGQVMSINAAEYLGVLHSAAYMRRWHRLSANSGSFLLTKCSHDLDMLCWLADSVPVRVASFGNNNFFHPHKQPATHCSKCPVADSCPYRYKGEFVYMPEEDAQDPSKRGFDLCVYNADKDIVDSQVSILEFQNGIRAVFSLQLFAPATGVGGRPITITGTDGYVTRAGKDGELIQVHSSIDNTIEEIDASPKDDSGHGGGDLPITQQFIDAIRSDTEVAADFRAGLISTVVGVAIEKARTEGRIIEIDPAEYEV